MLVPMSLGSRCGGMVYKLHALLHTCCLEVGSWTNVAELLGGFASVTTDQGAERLLGSVDSSFEELESWNYMPLLGSRGVYTDLFPGLQGGGRRWRC